MADDELRKITPEELQHILEQHKLWLTSNKREGKCADLRRTDLSKTHLEGAELSEAHLEGATLWQAHLEGALLNDAHLEKAKLIGVHLKGTYLNGAHLEEAKLIGVHLKGANLNEAHLEGAELCFANMEGITLIRAHLEGADLTTAHLEGADLFEAHLEGANLREADLRNAAVSGVTWDRKMKCRGARVESCYGSQMFKRDVQDMGYLEEFEEKHPWVYWCWAGSCDCGRSLGRWAIVSLLLIFHFGLIFSFIGKDAFDVARETAWQYWAPFQSSFAAFTSLGLGTITPLSDWAAFWVTAEMVIGYIMLGGLISIFANKLARRS